MELNMGCFWNHKWTRTHTEKRTVTNTLLRNGTQLKEAAVLTIDRCDRCGKERARIATFETERDIPVAFAKAYMLGPEKEQ
jgi:hypothetical protein